MSAQTTDKKRRVNAKKFVQDFRSGMTDDELIHAHGLTVRTLEKLLDTLLDKGLLDRVEVKRSRSRSLRRVDPAADVSPMTAPGQSGPDPDADSWGPVVRPPVAHGPDYPPVGVWKDAPRPSSSSCPQCGAGVSSKALICHECGHALSGEERWEQADTRRPLTERIHPLVLGSLLAAPVAIVLFFFFKDVILPASKVSMDKRIEDLRRETPAGKTPMGAARDMAKDVAVNVLETELRALISQGVFSAVDDDYKKFTAGPRWADHAPEALRTYLANIRATMKSARLTVDFEVVDATDQPLAHVAEQSISFVGEEGPEASPDHESAPERPDQPQTRPPEPPDRPVLPHGPAVRDQLKRLQIPHQPSAPPSE